MRKTLLAIALTLLSSAAFADSPRLKVHVTPFDKEPAIGQFTNVDQQTLNSIKDLKGKLKKHLLIVDDRAFADFVIIVGQAATFAPASVGTVISTYSNITTIEPVIGYALHVVNVKIIVPGTSVEVDASSNPLGYVYWKDAAGDSAKRVLTWVDQNRIQLQR